MQWQIQTIIIPLASVRDAQVHQSSTVLSKSHQYLTLNFFLPKLTQNCICDGCHDKRLDM